MKKAVKIIALLIGAFSVLLSNCTKPQDHPRTNGSNVTMFRANPQHTGVYNTEGVQQFHGVKWKLLAYEGNGMGTGGGIFSSPAIAEGIVYFGCNDGYVYAVDVNTEQKKWRFRTGGGVSSSPAVSDGVLYFGSMDGHLYAVDVNTGRQKWKFEAQSYIGSSPALADSVTYFGTWDGYIYAVHIGSGKEMWRFKTGNAIHGSPSVADGVIYFGSSDLYFYAVH